jgi:hypothetical protein
VPAIFTDEMARRPSASRRAAALRLVAARAEAGEALSSELTRALARERQEHPEDAVEIEGFAATEATSPPAWHLREVARRDLDDPDGDLASTVLERVRRQIRQRRTT